VFLLFKEAKWTNFNIKTHTNNVSWSETKSYIPTYSLWVLYEHWFFFLQNLLVSLAHGYDFEYQSIAQSFVIILLYPQMPSRIMHWWPHNPTIPQIQFDPVSFKQIQCAISTKWGAKNYILITNLACKEMCLGVIIWASNRSTYVQTHNFPPNDEQRIMFWSLI
jgi:hypothetical protein